MTKKTKFYITFIMAIYCVYLIGVKKVPIIYAATFDVSDGVLNSLQGTDTEIYTPDNVVKIGDRAFDDNKNLKWIGISEGVVSIGDEAFKGCSELSVIMLPNTIKSIGKNAFSDCSSTTLGPTVAITKQTDLSVVKWLYQNEIQFKYYDGEQKPDYVFNTSSIYYPQLNDAIVLKKIKYKVIRKSEKINEVCVTAIEKDTKSIAIPDTITYLEKTYKVTEIAKNACKNKSKVQKITVGRNVLKIRKNAFVNCKKLKKILIKNEKKKYSKNIFSKCSKNCKIIFR